MKVIAKPRGGGKTTELLRIANDHFYYIVCHTRDRCYQLADIAKDRGYDIPFPFTYAEYLDSGFYRKGIKGLAIDDLDLFVAYMSRDLVKAVTISTNDDNTENPLTKGG